MLFEPSQHRETLQLSSSPPSMKFMARGIQSQMRQKIQPENKSVMSLFGRNLFKRTAIAIVTLNQEADQ
jgi:hypothetical protein